MPETPLTTRCRAIAAKCPDALNLHGNMQWLRGLVYEDSPFLEQLFHECIALGAPQNIIDDANMAWGGIANSLELYGRMGSVLNVQWNGEALITGVCDWVAGQVSTPPVNTIPAPGNAVMDQPHNVNGVSVNSADVQVTVRLEAATGIDQIQVLNVGNVTGNNTDDVTIGPDAVANVNTALALIRLTPTAGFTGATGCQMTSTDGGGTDTDPIIVTYA